MVGAQSVQAYIYIYHLGLKFDLPVLPETITDSLSLDFQQQAVIGRSAPHITFTSAGPRKVNVNLKLHRQLFAIENQQIDNQTDKGYIMMPDPVSGKQTKVDAVDAADVLINALLALSVPKYLDGVKAIVPPSVLVRYGNEAWVRGVPGGVTKTSSGPWLKNGKQAEVQISFDVTETAPFSAQYTAQHGMARGLSTTLERSAVWQF
ncbi:MAG: hypothetical protein NC218_02375 [Acetobacter sp.]|nr:hypothetical protein [Acetobacter sp.]